MSEQLIQMGYTEEGYKIDKYQYYNIGDVSIDQLKKYNIVPKKNYGLYKDRQPDALLVDRRNKRKINVVAVIEHKQPSNFNTQKLKLEAACQCNTYCQVLGANIGIITDGNEYIWINPNVDINNAEVTYFDEELFGSSKLDKKRGFTYVKREDGYPLSTPFIIETENQTESNNSIKALHAVIDIISPECSQLHEIEYQNPSSLARSIHQDIWTATNAKPEKALSTFIEIFMFKFLSDLNVLAEDDAGTGISFDDVLRTGDDKCLKNYVQNVRPYIKEVLFPPNAVDGTTIINGMSLNPSVVEDNRIFYKIIKKFEEFGDLKNIDPEFKSRLFEDFLKQNTSKKNWGQFFTPRNVVKAIVEMSGIEKLQPDSNVCDPAVGVGGFILEPIATKRPNEFYFENGELKSKINYFGFERGIEQDDKLTIILAKANFVIYLSEVLKDNPTMTKEFAKMYNSIFKIYTDTILGSLSEVHVDKYDLIMSNPPYVMSGSANYKDAISRNGEIENLYTTKSLGLEGLFVQKILHELNENGTALIILPDGIMNRLHDKNIRALIKKKTIINAVISLPINTFYSTPKKTYILSLTKKTHDFEQTDPVFTYLVSDIGETLNVDRFKSDKNDLTNMVREYKYFMSETAKEDYSPFSSRCKIQGIDRFSSDADWSVDKWWTNEEKIELGIEDEKIVLSEVEFYGKLEDIKTRLETLIPKNRNEEEGEDDGDE